MTAAGWHRVAQSCRRNVESQIGVPPGPAPAAHNQVLLAITPDEAAMFS